LEDQLSVAAMRNRTDPHRHFLHDNSGNERDRYEGEEKTDAIGGTARCIGQHAWTVVLAK
jgi:hypothetical protein